MAIAKFDGPIPGQSWQHAPRTMPWDRPAQFTDVTQALVYMFKRLRQPAVTKQLLNLVDAGMPVDMLAQGLLTQGFMKGTFSATALVPMVGPLVVMLIRMAETAGLHPITSNQKNKNVDIDPSDMMAAQARVQNNTAAKAIGANDKSVKDLTAKNVMDKQGFMAQRPKMKNGRIL